MIPTRLADLYLAVVAELPKVHGRHRNKALAAARRVRAVELKTAGYTYAEVADELGCTSRGTAYNIVAKALREQTAEAVTDLRDLENARLDALQLALWVAAMTGDQCRCCRREDRAGTGSPERSAACEDRLREGPRRHREHWWCLKQRDPPMPHGLGRKHGQSGLP